MARTLADIPDLLMSIVEGEGYAPDGCWPWPRCRNDHGYGLIRIERASRYVHILSYQAFVGPVPAGFQLDHECHDPRICGGGPGCPHRPCFNFGHLRPVTPAENSRRSSPRFRPSCPQGHLYDEANDGRRKNGRRYCRQCSALYGAAWKKARRKAAEPRVLPSQCSSGHDYDEPNTYIHPETGHRACRACRRDQARRARQEKVKISRSEEAWRP